jgi:hypothetical protein
MANKMNTQIEPTQFTTNLWRAAHNRRPRLEYDDAIDTLILHFVEVAQTEIIVTHYIDEYVFLLFKNSDHEIVGMGVEGFQRGFAPIYANAASWKLSNTGVQLPGVTDLVFAIQQTEHSSIAQRTENIRIEKQYKVKPVYTFA